MASSGSNRMGSESGEERARAFAVKAPPRQRLGRTDRVHAEPSHGAGLSWRKHWRKERRKERVTTRYQWSEERSIRARITLESLARRVDRTLQHHSRTVVERMRERDRWVPPLKSEIGERRGTENGDAIPSG